MAELNDGIDNGPINKFRAMFAEYAAHRGSDGSHIPMRGDIRVHFTDYPLSHWPGTGPIDVTRKVQGFLNASTQADRLLGSMRDNGVDPIDHVVAMFSKEPVNFPADRPQRMFVDLDLTQFKKIWDMLKPHADPETIRNTDMLVSDRTFQLQCLLADIEKVETPNVFIDLTRFKNLAIQKPRGPAQSRLEF